MFSVAACDNPATPSEARQPSGQPALSVEAQAAHQSLGVIAHAVAVAMEQEEVRLAVRDAMRDSPWDVHQISLQEFATSAQGAGLVGAAAAAGNETPGAFLARLQNLPDLDFYVPSRVQRRTWRGTPGAVVAASANPESGQMHAFGPNGKAVPDVLSGGMGNRLVLLIVPAEPRGRRNKLQPQGVGDVIQSAADGETAVRYTWTDASGHTTVVDPTGDGEGAFSTQSYGDSTYLDYAYFNSNDPGDDLELTFRARFYRPDGSYMGEWTYTNYSFPYQQQWYGHQPLLLPVLPDSSNAYIELRIREEDGWMNPDEIYGPRNFTWVDRGQIRRMNAQGSNTIYADIELDWVRRSRPVLTSVSVAGVYVESGSSTSTYATPIDQYGWAMSGLSVSSWWTGNTSIATTSSPSGTSTAVNGISAGYTSVYATIGGVTGSGSVSVEEPMPPCDQQGTLICPQ
jgi:hypothetical protein